MQKANFYRWHDWTDVTNVTRCHSVSSTSSSFSSSSLSSSSSHSDSCWRLRTTESSPRMCESSLRRCVILGMPASWASSRCFSSFSDSRVPVSRASKRQLPSPSNCSRCVWNFLRHKPSENYVSTVSNVSSSKCWSTIVLRPFFRDHPHQPVPEENFWTLWCKGRLTEADTPTIRLGATPSVPTSTILPIFFTGRIPFLPPSQQRQSTEGN